MFIVWPVIFGVMAGTVGTLGFTGAAHGWLLLAKALHRGRARLFYGLVGWPAGNQKNFLIVIPTEPQPNS